MKPKLIIDTREQLPLDFGKSRTFEVVSQKLDEGDYGCFIGDAQVPIVFERKSAPDLFNTLTRGHTRFKAEIQRAKDKGLEFVVIVETSYSNILNKKFDKSYLIKTAGDIIIKILHTMEQRYGIRFVFCNDRDESKTYINNVFISRVKSKTRGEL